MNLKAAQNTPSGTYERIITSPRGQTTRIIVPEALRKVLDAYDIYKNSGVAGWHRDYIYYNLTPTNTLGPFNYNLMEHIVTFEMVNDADANLRIISDQIGKDPQRTSNTSSRGPYWTDGEFEFIIKIYIGNKAGFSNELLKYLRISPSDLFNIRYEILNNCYRCSASVVGVTNKKVYVSLPLFEWNLESYTSTVKVSIEEKDDIQTSKIGGSTTTEFAANFGFDVGFGESIKKGLKFGASGKHSVLTSYEQTTTLGSDNLGDVVINFGDNIIIDRSIEAIPSGTRVTEISEGTLSYNPKYESGYYRISIAPKKMY